MCLKTRIHKGQFSKGWYSVVGTGDARSGLWCSGSTAAGGKLFSCAGFSQCARRFKSCPNHNCKKYHKLLLGLLM
jgi:hypothetical protein